MTDRTPSTEDQSLMPCPFCGSGAKLEHDHGTYEVSCTHCAVRTGYFSSERSATRTWNARPSPEPTGFGAEPAGFDSEPTGSTAKPTGFGAVPCAEPILWQARRKNRFTGEWDDWAELNPRNIEAIKRDIANKSLPDEWEIRALYSHAPEPSAELLCFYAQDQNTNDIYLIRAHTKEDAVARFQSIARKEYCGTWLRPFNGPAAMMFDGQQSPSEPRAKRIEYKVRRESPEHREYLAARFPPGGTGGSSFEWKGHRWAYSHTSFDDDGDFDLLWRPGSPGEPAGKCGTCGESIKPDRLTGTTCACVTRMRDCICSDPENCREPVPGRRCKTGFATTKTAPTGSATSELQAENANSSATRESVGLSETKGAGHEG